MSLIASDGYEYEDLKARLLGQPKDSPRNKIVSFHRRQGKPEGFVKAWIEGYDADTNPTTHHQRRQHNAQVATNLWLHANSSRDRTGEPAPVPTPPAALHPAD